MKYVVSWEARPSVTEEAAKRSLTVFSKWSPTHPEQFQAFLGRLDGNGGFAVIDTDDPTAIAKDTAPFIPWFDFHVYPCVDITERAAIDTEAIAFLESVT